MPEQPIVFSKSDLKIGTRRSALGRYQAVLYVKDVEIWVDPKYRSNKKIAINRAELMKEAVWSESVKKTRSHVENEEE